MLVTQTAEYFITFHHITSMTKIGSKMELNHIRPRLSWIGWTQSLAKECLPWRQDRGSYGLHPAQIWNLVTSTCGEIWMKKSTSQCQRPYWNSSKRSLKFFFQFLKKMSKSCSHMKTRAQKLISVNGGGFENKKKSHFKSEESIELMKSH